MPDSTIATPCNFGNWSGPGYAGGTLSLTPEKFVDLYKQVNARGFLDAAAKQHDAVYEYAERVYGTNPSGEMKAMKNAVLFIADMDLVKNALAYKPPVGDFIGVQYRQMLVTAFYFQAVKTYGFAAQMEKYWDEVLQPIDPGYPKPQISGSLAGTVAGSPWLLATLLGPNAGPFGWGAKGLEKLATSDFLADQERYDNLGLTQQEMLLFNPHLTGGQIPTRPYDAGAYEIADGGLMVVIPTYDKANNRFQFIGTWNGKAVQMYLTDVDEPIEGRDFELRVKEGNVWNVTKWDANSAADEIYGNRTYAITQWVEDENGAVIQAPTSAGTYGPLSSIK